MKVLAALLLCAASASPAAAQFMYYNHVSSRVETGHSLSLSGPLWANSDLSATEIRTTGWFRNYDASQGLYAQAYGAYFYPSSTNLWVMGGGGTTQELVFRNTLAGTLYGVLTNSVPGTGIGFRNLNNTLGLYVPINSSRVYVPAPGGLEIVSTSRITSNPETMGMGSINLATGKGGYYGILLGQTNTAPNLMFQNSTYGGIYVEGNGGWKVLWYLDTSPIQYALTGSLYTIGASYTVRARDKRVLTKVSIHTLSVGLNTTAGAPGCPTGTSWAASGCGGYACWNECYWGSAAGWGGWE